MWPFGNDSSNSNDTPTIPFEHRTSSRTRRLSIKIGRGGKVIVVSPPLVPKFVINQFVAQHANWISEKLQQIGPTQQNKATVSLFGKDYRKAVKYLPGKPLGICIQADAIVANTPEAEQSAIIWGKKQDQQLLRFLKSTASSYLLTRIPQLATKMKIQYGKVTLREQYSRWGSCSSTGNLNFNWRLVHAAPAVIDYVIVHELAHRVHMDHSRNFWNLVAQYDPDYQLHRGRLKRHGHGLM